MSVVRPPAGWPEGRVIRISHRSKVLEGNPWGDPVERELPVYVPAGYREAGEAHIALWDLAAFTNSGPGHLNWRNHGENLVQRLDRLIHEEKLPPVLVPMPDCYTSLGGNQYLNSAGVGRYADYLLEELLPLISERFNVVDGREGRAAFGKSSGGYGALYHAMHYPEAWGAVAAHAADCGFENVYRPEFPWAARVLADHGGDAKKYMRAFWRSKVPGRHDFGALMALAMAASYDPDPDDPATIRLPFDLQTLELDEGRWARWKAHDPLEMAPRHVDALNKMALLYFDVGNRDQYHIQFGMRALSRDLEKLGVRHHYEEFDGTHSNIDWRLDTSLPMLAGALNGIESTD